MALIILFVNTLAWPVPYRPVAAASTGVSYYVDPTCKLNGNGLAQACAAQTGGDGPFNSLVVAQSKVKGDQSDRALMLKRGQIFTGPFQVKAWGSQGHPFTITGYGEGSRPVITRGGNNVSITCADCHYIVIDGLELSQSTRLANLYIASPAGNITVRNASLHHAASNTVMIIGSSGNIIEDSELSWSASEGIRILVGQPPQPTTENIIRNNKIHNNLRYGILASGNDSQVLDGSGSQIYGNEAYNNSTGIYLVLSNHFEVYSNNLHDNGKNCQSTSDCPGEPYGLAIQSGSFNTIRDNIITRSYKTGLGIYGEQSPKNQPSDGNRIYRNVISNTIDGNPSQKEIEFQCWGGNSTGSDNLFYDNIVWGSGFLLVIDDTNPDISGNAAYNNLFYGGTAAVDFEGSSTSAGWTFKNNIFAGNSEYAVDAGRRSGGLALLNNLYYKPSGGTLVRFAGTDYAADALVELDSQAVLGEPLFYGAASDGAASEGAASFGAASWYDFRPRHGSPVIDRGLDLGNDFRNGLDADYEEWPPVTANQNGYGSGWEIGPFVYKTAASRIPPSSPQDGGKPCGFIPCN